MAEEEDTYYFQKELSKAKEFSFSDSKVVDRSETAVWIEPTQDVEQYDLDSVKDTFKVQGFELDEPPPPDPDAIEKALKRADPIADFKRNREEYGILCPVCFNKKKCVECGGRGRKKLIFKCKNCDGTGKCPDCDRDIDVRCPQCEEPISKYSDRCLKCGLQFTCDSCGSPLPSMATKCISCKQEHKCKSCRKPYPRHYSWRCPHCHHWNE